MRPCKIIFLNFRKSRIVSYIYNNYYGKIKKGENFVEKAAEKELEKANVSK